MKDYAVLIPTKGRPDALIRMFKKVPSLNCADTFIGIEPAERTMYQEWHRLYGTNCTIVAVDNPGGWASNAREPLRKRACAIGYQRYFSSDDNAIFSAKSMKLLLAAQDLEKCVMSGLGVPALWHKEAIENGIVHRMSEGSITTFESYSTVHWVIPHNLYADFRYPENCSNDDVFFMLWAILKKNFSTFRSCLEAKYSKKRFEIGGHGTSSERLYKMASSMLLLSQHFPEVASHTWMQTRFPFRQIVEQLKVYKET